ncbi:helix-turn-helix transcriptional regulator [uncultured Paracoccus sp.]|uniref:helix-turn-helix domain-containing protein n=1 Tax=uncultured Paracoccus sp. TaxID=189685 RepID=UPI00261F10CC|nr:helix-turn-helix transcriptional regulator [uncultured Paracoccus sp.]
MTRQATNTTEGDVLGEDFYSDDKATLGDRINAAREGAGLTPEALARKLGVRTSTLNGWEHDEREPRANHLRMLAGLMGVSLVWLLSGQGQGPSGEAATAQASAGGASRDAILTEFRALQQSLREATRRLARLEKLLADG